MPIAEGDPPLGVIGDATVMRDQHDSPPFVVERPEERHDLFSGRLIERAGRLIRQQNTWIVDQRPGNRDSLLLPAGQFGGPVVRPVRQSHRRQMMHRPLPPLACSHGGVGQRQLDILQRGMGREQVEALEDETQLTIS